MSKQLLVGQVLTAAQNAENTLATNPSVKAKVLRILIGGGMAAVGAADFITNYVYTQKDTATGKQATSWTLGSPIDLGLITGGLINVYLGIINWDTKAKQADAAAATALVKGHLAQLAAPAAAPAAGSAQV